MSDILFYFGSALLLTILIEGMVAVCFRAGISFRRIVLVNTITNPVLLYLMICINYFTPVSQTGPILISLEIAIVFIEWKLFEYALEKRSYRLLLYSFLANATSYGVGVLLTRLDILY